MTHTHDLNCDVVRQNLSDYIDGDLGPDLCNIIDDHIKDCSNCQIIINTLKKTITLYKMDGQSTALPEDIRQRLFAKFKFLDDAQ